MPFITQGKTNFQYILIVIVIGVLTSGGILGYYYLWIADLDSRLAQLEQRLPEVKAPETATELITSCNTDAYCEKYIVYNQCKIYCGNKDIINPRIIENLEKTITCDPTLWNPPGIGCECISGQCVFEKIYEEVTSWESYKNEWYGYEVEYPKDWRVINNSYAYIDGGERERLSNVKFSTNYIDSMFAIRVYDNSQSLSLSEWLDSYSMGYRGCTVDKRESIVVAGVDGIKGNHSCDDVVGEGIFLPREDKVYNIDLLRSTTEFPIEVLEKIYSKALSTFKFIDFGDFDSAKISKVISFIDSKSVARKLFLYNTFDENYQVNLYITDEDFNRDSAIRIMNLAETDISDSPYVSLSGKRYIVIEKYGMGDSFGLAIADEDGKIITYWLASEHSDLNVVWNFERWESSSTFWAKAEVKREGNLENVEILVDAETTEVIEIKPLPQ